MNDDFILLVGNGINNINGGYTWEDLIQEVKSKLRLEIVSRRDKPFPLEYEEICSLALKDRNTIEDDITNKIASFAEKIEENEVHQKIIDIGSKNILTTNYDLGFEKTFDLNAFDSKNKGVVKERKYNLFRRFSCGDDTSIWHIHGTCVDVKTITLGYDHYIGYCQRMRGYIVNGTGDAYKTKFEPIIEKLRKNIDLELNSWVEFFFVKDVYIIGLGLSFIEFDLWWLLTYRSRINYDKKISCKNKIFYYTLNSDDNPSKEEMLSSVGVEVLKIEGVGRDFYLKVIEDVKNKIRK